jgi:cytochrome c peroxidase
MRKLNFLMAFFFILTSFPLTGQKQVFKAITTVNVQSLGPQKLGNLSPVITPVNNPQASLKILLGKQLYFDTRLSKDNTISCATCHNPS